MPVLSRAIVLIALAGCTQVPALDERLTPDLRNAPYPRLIPLDDALGPPHNPQQEASELEDQLTARRDQLAARARLLQTPVVDDAARDRLEQDIDG
ncbi:MAG: hypothetical protein AB3N22_16490 [Ruegeria sp.]